jgi:hypothetical protein
MEIGARMQARMDIAVDDPQAGFRNGFLVGHGAVDDITHAILQLDYDPIGSDHSPVSLFEHDLFGKPVPTFPDHAL